jgi:hypothetical protein
VVVAAGLLAGCGGSSPPPAVDVSGTWVGNVDSTDGMGQPVYGGYEATFRLTQTAGSVTGSYSGAGAVGGTVVGGVSGNHFVATIQPRECAGQLNLSALVSEPAAGAATMDVTYQGTTVCSGARVDRGTLTRQ